MNIQEKFKFLESELDSRIKDFTHKRIRAKKKAFNLKLFAVVFAATVTVLLGLKVNETLSKVFQNVALILGAVITILNAVEAFYDHRSLWIRRTVTLARLYELRRDVHLCAVGSESKDMDSESKGMDAGALYKFMKRYDQILSDDLNAWLKLRQDSPPLRDSSGDGDGK